MTCVEKIEYLLMKSGKTKSDLSKAIGISSGAFSNWKAYNRIPKADTLQKIADYLGTTTDNLLDTSDIDNRVVQPIVQSTQKKVAYDKLDDAIKEKSRSEKRDEFIEKESIPITGKIPILGVIRAGVPILAEENIEGYEFTTVSNPQDYYYLRVTGDSMINAGIPEGALVLIHKQDYAENGDIVVCLTDDESATIKKFHQKGRTISLIPANPDYDPILLDISDFDPSCGSARILGVAKKVVTDL